MLKSALPCLLIGVPVLVGISFVWPALQALHTCEDAGARLFQAMVERGGQVGQRELEAIRRTCAAQARPETAATPAPFKALELPVLSLSK